MTAGIRAIDCGNRSAQGGDAPGQLEYENRAASFSICSGLTPAAFKCSLAHSDGSAPIRARISATPARANSTTSGASFAMRKASETCLSSVKALLRLGDFLAG
jgi:hypothetical protein